MDSPLSNRREIFQTNIIKLAYRTRIVWCASFLLILTLCAGACFHKGADVVDNHNAETPTYTTMTTSVNTLISDSGITRYKLQSKVWYTYDSPEEYWHFPEGIYVEQFDTLFNIKASISADTAYYYQDKNLWLLKENVKILNKEGQRFFAKTLYWDEKKQEIYSVDSITIQRSEGELLKSKYGFKSNQDMTKYELYSSSGHLDVKSEPSLPAPSDSLTANPPLTEKITPSTELKTEKRDSLSTPQRTNNRDTVK